MDVEAKWHLRFLKKEPHLEKPQWHLATCETIEEVQAIFRKKTTITDGATVIYKTSSDVTKAFV